MNTVRIAGIGFLAWWLLGSQAMAMCIWFAPPGRVFEPAKNIKLFYVAQDERRQLVVQPQFAGSATDFALVMPFPSRPQVHEAPTFIFDQLEDLTNPVQAFDDPIALLENAAGISSVPQRGVEVLEQRDVGDYTAAVLRATDTSELLAWLGENGYEITDNKRQALDVYIAESAYFVALKVNMTAADVDSQGLLRGELRPIEFRFSSATHTLPMRLMAGEKDMFNLIFYTLSNAELYVPGAEMQFARKLSAKDNAEFEALEGYDAQGKWLVRSSIQFDPGGVMRDFEFSVAPRDVVVDQGDETVRINPDLLDSGTGLVESERGSVYYVTEQKDMSRHDASSSAIGQSMPLLMITVILGVSNVVLLHLVLKRRTEQSIE